MHPATHATTWPDKPAIQMASTGEIVTYRDLDRRSNQSAWRLRELGLTRGAVVACLFGNAPEAFVFAWAAQRTGLYLTSISNKLSANDIAYILKDSGAKLLVVSDSLADLAERAAADVAGLPVFAWSRRHGALPAWEEAARHLPTAPVADQSPGADLLYSSGTTGRPKGVMPPLPEGPIDHPTALTAMGTALYGMGTETVYLSTSPLYHAAPLRWAMTVHRLGGTVIVMECFDAEQTLALIDTSSVTHATFVPTHFVRMLKLPEAVRGRYQAPALRAAIHAAAPCPVPVKQAMIDWWGPILFEYYSGTESCGITALSSEEWLRKPGSVGRAVLGTLKILGPDGQESPAGQDGQVYFADGPAFSYLNDPIKTAEAHNALGWATLGDIGHIDEDGYLFLTDRKSFMIISGGVNIYPQEIENHLVSHPKVADAAVFGAPDEEMGERVVAVIQPLDLADATEAFRNELQRYARAGLGGVKTPREFHFRGELPREPTGKLLKRRLRDEVLAATPSKADQEALGPNSL